jgi:hypothetical protein
MGSSVSGSLDKFAKISPAAALVSGKVKLPGGPTGGVIGMLQEDMIGSAEAKQAQNAANMQMMQQEQNQQNQYNQMLQQMMMQQQQRPYANGGNVALRRKMFKLGGSASAHGTGLTSGLSFNQGGPVVKPGPDGKPRQHAILGGIIAAARAAAAAGRLKNPMTPIMNYLRFGQSGQKGLDAARKAAASKLIKAGTKADDITPEALEAIMRAGGTRQFFRGLETVGGVGTPFAAASLLGGPRMTEEERKTATDFEKGLDTTRGVVEFLPSLTGVGAIGEIGGLAADTIIESMKEDPDYFQAVTIPDLIRKAAGTLPDRDKTQLELGQDSIEPGISIAELSERASQRQREDLEAAMAMYQDLIRGDDNTNKLATLGDAAIAAGSALMEGEGYGGAAAAFNEPLSQARAAQRELDQTARGAAAQLAIGEDIASRQQDEALFAELAATGQFDTAEQISQVVLARKFGVTRTVPEDDKGEIDEDALATAGAGVYVDPKTRFGTVFIAVNSDNKVESTNDPEVAKQHAKS